MEKPKVIQIPTHRLEWTSDDSSIHKAVLEEGQLELEKPRTGSSGEVSVSNIEIDCETDLATSGSQYLNSASVQPLEFCLGLAQTTVDRKFEEAIQHFLLGEESRVRLKVFLEPNLNTRPSKLAPLIEPLWVTVECNIKLVSLVNASPIYSWFPETKVAKAKEAYAIAVDLFKEGRFLDAFFLFQRAHTLSVFTQTLKKKKDASQKSEDEEMDDSEPSAVELEAGLFKLNSLNNLAACHFQWKNHRSVIELSTKVLEATSDPRSCDRRVKTLYRRGVSYLGIQEFELAEKDLVSAHKLDSSNRAVNEQLGQVRSRRKMAEAELSKRMCKMFQ